MNRVAMSIARIKSHYEVVVVGSGYGGGIAASRMARAGRKVCLLERGREFIPGEFPDTFVEASAETQIDTPGIQIGSKTALFDFHVNDDINVLVGCGLGGTSLINAGVVIKPVPDVFNDPAWPREFIADLKKGVADGYECARTMLNCRPYPTEYPALRKREAQQKSARAMNEDCYEPEIAVTFARTEGDTNHFGVKQSPCILCGDCVSGCNHTSKNTVQMNYLPDAWNHGAEIFTETNVRYVERQGGLWIVHFRAIGGGSNPFNGPSQFVSADIVILAAGTLGSTEILLRSREKGLAISDLLGRRFGGNGDFLGFSYNGDQEINAIGWGARKPDPNNPVGPCITSIIDIRTKVMDYKEGMSIEEGVIPGALSQILPLTFSALSKLIGKDMDVGIMDYLSEKKRELESLVRGPYYGAMKHTQTYLVMAHDSMDGVMYLEDDRLRIRWPNVGKQKIFEKVRNNLVKAVQALGGTYIPNPIWSEVFGHDLVTVHPLGGCVMGENARSGVVNHKGQVFSSNDGTRVHEGLYIMDGAVIPTSIGTNPLFTICAIAERNVALLANERGFKFDYKQHFRTQRSVELVSPGIQFTETMKGYFSTSAKEDHERAFEVGRLDGSPFSFTLTIISDDVREMLKERGQATITGTVSAPALSGEPLMVTAGTFNLFENYPDEVNTRRMWYRMSLTSQDGKAFYVEGYKVIRDDPGLDLWSDTSTLFITVYGGKDSGGPLLGKGILRIEPGDFMKQLRTIRINNANSMTERLRYQAEFGKSFAGQLFDTYGGIFARQRYFDPEAPPRKQRDLCVSAPEVYDINTEDGVKIRLSRYKGGDKGPVILSHGLGVSSRIFSIDTIDTNLLEFLFEHRYDVWLLDYRASIELPAANSRFSADEIGRYDYPAAIAFVKERARKDSVQMVVHCFGATAWTASMLGGWIRPHKDVRSAVISQVSTHMKVPLLTKLKTGLHVPGFLDKMGIDSLTAYTDKHSDWLNRLFDDALRVYPMESEETCNNPVCQRVTFLYGHLYEHDQLNDSTHESLHEMFGVANITSFEHLALMARKGHIVSSLGQEVYMPYLERLAIPITFISGEENQCFLPESTEISYNLLREKNGKELYKRFIIPRYGHIDCVYGKNASMDVYPHILKQLEETAL